MKQPQTDRILCYMATGKPLTPIAALKRFGCFRLAARVNDLRGQGYNILTQRVKLGGAVVAQYRLAH